MIRNIANIIPPKNAEESCTSSVLEYAVIHLNVEHIVICGHTECGGINALIEGTPKDSKIDDWLKHACSAKEAAEKSEENSLVLETIKQNILLQENNLLTFDFIEEKFMDGKIQLHKWLYDMQSGEISFFEESEWFPIN